MEVIIRKADGFDAPILGVLMQEWLKETNFQYPGVCPYSHVWLANFIFTQICFVAEKEGKVIGAIGMKYANFPWNNEYFALFCEFLMVLPQYRTDNVAVKLIKAVKQLSDETKLPVFLGIMTGLLAEKKDRFLETCGFEYAGSNFVYGV